ncbi:element excision factor XisI family protein [Myxosarcina sp. GI1]|uniref:element excision factor XisI family protein n=1 Tax=Myxosarcina sp. GI1 TaxID=1541065 RepID=UPI00068C4EDA|nr:element excision factor XisI family protein [Myxosarcina sp. GI1]
MESTEEYRKLILNILKGFIKTPYQYQNVTSKLMISEDLNNYLIMIWGIHDTVPIHKCIVHVEICNGKICIRRQHKRYDVYAKIPYTIPQHDYELCDYACREDIDFAISLEKIYQFHQTLFVFKTAPESDYGQPSIKTNATSAELIKLASVGHDFINNKIAQHPNTPPELLIKLFSKFPVQVLTNSNLDLIIIENQNFLEQLYESFPNCFYQKYIDIPTFFIEWAANHLRKDIRAKVASSYQIPDLLLKKLINDDSCEIINNLYINSSIKGEIKKQIEKKRSQFIDSCQKRKNKECECNGEYLPF